MSNVILNDTNTKTLGQWLNFNEVFKDSLICLRDPSMLTQILVNDSRVTRYYASMERTMSISDLVDLVLLRLFKASTNKPTNILTLGYRTADSYSDRLKLDSMRAGITNHYINTNISWLLSGAWKDLYAVIGDDRMLDLLLHTSMFVTVENGCLAQVSGTPVFDTAGMYADPVKNERHKSREKERRAIKPAAIPIARYRLFYGRPLFYSTTKKIYAIGLPSTHVLNRLDTKMNNFTSSPPHYLMKHIFPHQHKLKSVFAGTNGVSMSYSRLMRDEEIKSLKPTTPKRLEHLAQLFERMLQRHHNFDYSAALKRHCKSKTRGHQLDMTQYMDEDFLHASESIQSTQQRDTSLIATQMSKQATDLVPFRQDIKAPPCFQDLQCSHTEVKAFVKNVLADIIPKKLFGSTANKLKIFDSVDTFISMRKYETVTLHNLAQGLQMKDFQCFYSDQYRSDAKHNPKGVDGKTKKQRVPQSEQNKVNQIVLEWLYWLFEDLIIPLLKNTFYVSDSSADRKRTYYYRHDDWLRATEPLLEQLSNSIFEKASDALNHSYRRLQPSYVRLMPKETGVRPIVNLRKQNWVEDERFGQKVGYKRGKSINNILRSAFDVLSYERLRQPDVMGASLLGSQEAYERMKEYKKRILSQNNRKLYFVKADIQCCFDTIDQHKLMEMLDEIIQEDDYIILKHQLLSLQNDKFKREFKRQAVPEYEQDAFLGVAATLSKKLRNAILSDQVVHPHIDKDDLLKLLKEHIMENLIKINNKLYRQATGIPQGSILSTVLCSFFYGMLERNEMRFVQESKTGLMLRFIDDFLFITTSREEARYFLETLRKGFPQYGAKISEHKTLVNFDISFDGVETINRCQRSDEYFAWCGILLNTKNLDIKADYSKTFESDVRNSFSVGDGCRVGQTVTQKLTQSFKQHAHALYSDCNFNSSDTVKRNLYENYLVAAVKLGVFLTDVLCMKRVNIMHLQAVIAKVVEFGIRYTLFKVSTKKDSCCTIPPRLIHWLGYKAFERVLMKLVCDNSLRNAVKATCRKLLRGVTTTVNSKATKRYQTNKNLNKIIKHSLNSYC